MSAVIRSPAAWVWGQRQAEHSHPVVFCAVAGGVEGGVLRAELELHMNSAGSLLLFPFP